LWVYINIPSFYYDVFKSPLVRPFGSLVFGLLLLSPKVDLPKNKAATKGQFFIFVSV